MTDRDPGTVLEAPVDPETGSTLQTGSPSVPEWQFWPPGSKMQIAMIAAMFGLFNLILVVIVAVIVVTGL